MYFVEFSGTELDNNWYVFLSKILILLIKAFLQVNKSFYKHDRIGKPFSSRYSPLPLLLSFSRLPDMNSIYLWMCINTVFNCKGHYEPLFQSQILISKNAYHSWFITLLCQ